MDFEWPRGPAHSSRDSSVDAEGQQWNTVICRLHTDVPLQMTRCCVCGVGADVIPESCVSWTMVIRYIEWAGPISVVTACILNLADSAASMTFVMKFQNGSRFNEAPEKLENRHTTVCFQLAVSPRNMNARPCVAGSLSSPGAARACKLLKFVSMVSMFLTISGDKQNNCCNGA